MAAQDCIDEIRAAAGRPLSDDEVTQILEELERRRRNRRAGARLETLEEELLNAADELVAELDLAARIEQRNGLINIKVLNDARRFAGLVDQATGDPSLALSARNVGINARVPEARVSADGRAHALMTQYLGGLIAALRRDGLLEIFNSRQLEREIARELAELSKPAEAARPGRSGSREAERIAKAIDQVRRAAVARENRAGAWIRPLPGYVVRQSHDMHKLRRAGFQAWRETVLPLLDADRTFGGADPEAFLKGAYDGLVSGRHIRSGGSQETDVLFAFKGPSNLAKRISEHRVLHFRDADAFMDYNARFGRGTLTEALFHEFERAARNTALMETWGTNPRAAFDRILGELKDKHRGDPEKLDRLNRSSLQNQFDEVEGLTRIPVSPSSAAVTSGILAVETLSKLGGATLSAFGDLGFRAGELAREGRGNLLQVWRDNLSSLLEGMAPADRRLTAELIGVGIDGQIGAIASRFSAQDDLPGRLAKLHQVFFKLNLLAPWTDGNKRGLALLWSRELAMKAGQGFEALDPGLRELFGIYGIDGPRWEVLRRAVRPESDGRTYLMPDAVRDLPDEAFAGLTEKVTPRAARKLRDELETALRSYYVDRAEAAVPTPGARERAILRQGTRPGTPAGIAARLVGQFKAFPVTVLTRVLGRQQGADTTADFFRNLANGKGDVMGLVHMIVATTVLGYVAQSAKELAKGRSPRDPADPATWQAALLQGGGLGIYGDFLFGEFNRFGRSLTATLAGPALGTADDIAELLARIRAGEDPAAQALRVTAANTPFLNLFYTRLAIDYLVLFQLQEAANPGFLKRMERRISRENKQTFILPPSRAIPTGGGGRLFEGVR